MQRFSNKAIHMFLGTLLVDQFEFLEYREVSVMETYLQDIEIVEVKSMDLFLISKPLYILFTP